MTTNSPRRSHWNELVQSGKVHLPPTPASRTSSLKRVKNLPPYAKRSSPHTLDPSLLYGTTTATGQYRSPSRILFESGYLTLGRHRHHHHASDDRNHIYENLYNSPSSPSHKSGDQVDGSPPATVQSQPSSDQMSPRLYQNNLRDSVQLKSTSCPECMTSREGSCSRHRPPEIPPNHPNHRHHHSHHRNHSEQQPRVATDEESGGKTDSLSSGCSTVQSNLYGKMMQSQGLKSTDQLNHHIITMHKEHKGSSPSASSSSHKGKAHLTKSPAKSGTSTDVKKHKKRKKQKEWFFESDPQRRFQFLQSTLIIVNVIGIFAGLTGLIAAGFVDPVYKLHTFGGQMCLASVYTLAASLVGLYGARRESCTLLVTYAIMIIVTLFFRSVVYFIATLVTPSSGAWIALSMITALFEVLLILFAFGLAAEVRIKKQTQAAIAAATTAASATTAESEISVKSSTGSPSPITEA